MINKICKILVSLTIILGVCSCEKDSNSGNNEVREFIVAFKEQSILYKDINGSVEIPLVFSHIAQQSGSVEVLVVPTDVELGVEFQTIPEPNSSFRLNLPFEKGDSSVGFVFENLLEKNEITDGTVQFKIEKINYQAAEPVIRGFDILYVSNNASMGGVIAPDLGGPNEKNQVYVSLADKATYVVERDSWDLAFYNQDDFVVKLNSSIYMAAKKLAFTDITQPLSTSLIEELKQSVKIGTFDPYNIAYIDDPSGNLSKTAIAKISENDNENFVYFLNMGSEPGSNVGVVAGSVNVAGKARGWKKIRILKRGDDYLLQWADLQSSTYEQKLLKKDSSYNFNFFSFNTNNLTQVEPTAHKWDMNFTVFTNTIDQRGESKGSYGFSDFILNNRYGGVSAYMVTIADGDKNYYKDFELSQVDPGKFSFDLRTIGGTWRDVTSDKILFKNIFYVLKDAEGNYYKFRMLSFTDDKGNRGYPRFEYSLLQ
ncbi:HmuY family protein [Myroides sp. LJL119]